MQETTKILQRIKGRVLQVVPGAEVSLFGSRATGTAHAESDWDILVLTNGAVTKQTKVQIQETVFPISVEIASFINLLIVYKKDWEATPAYYALRTTLKHEREAKRY